MFISDQHLEKEGEESILERGKHQTVEEPSKVSAFHAENSGMSTAHQSVPCQTQMTRVLDPWLTQWLIQVALRMAESWARQLFAAKVGPNSTKELEAIC